MSFLLDQLNVLWPWLVLASGLVLIWLGFRVAAWIALVFWTLAALAAGLVQLPAAALTLAGIAMAWALPRMTGWKHVAGHAAFIFWAIALAAHLIPGFHNIPVLEEVQSGPDSTPYTLYLNFDKPLLLFALILAWPQVMGGAARIRPALLGSAVLLAAVLLPLAAAAHAIKWEPALPTWLLLFVLANLLQTCLVEEAFFRGYLQRLLIENLGPVRGIGLASLLFGLAHFPGGLALIAFASLLGLACGLAMHASNRLSPAIWLHFGFNLAHLLLFTYPAAA